MEPPEVQSIQSMLHVARILAIIFAILFLVAGIFLVVLRAYTAIWLVIAGLIAILVYTQMRSIADKVNAHQYEAAKSQTLLWLVLGLIFGIVLGIILLIAYIKFDTVITLQRSQGQPSGMGYPPAPVGYQPPSAMIPQQAGAPMAQAPMPATPPPPPSAAAPPTPFCSKCGKPTTYIAQYGRYYCYDDKLYV